MRGGASLSLEGAELLAVVAGALSELDGALRSFGRSLSSLLEGLLESSELEVARRSLGRSALDELSDEAVDESADGLVMGRVGSSVACDAEACSSSVPSLIIAMLLALYFPFLSSSAVILT
jgi:hypothetical protein